MNLLFLEDPKMAKVKAKWKNFPKKYSSKLYKQVIEVDEKDVTVTDVRQFLKYDEFNARVYEVCGYCGTGCSKTRWAGMINTASQDMQIIVVESDSTETGLLRTEYFWNFIGESRPSDNLDLLLQNQVVIKDGFVHFRIVNFISYLKLNKVSKTLTQANIVSVELKKAYKSMKEYRKRLKGKMIRYNTLNIKEIELQNESFDIPEINTGGM